MSNLVVEVGMKLDKDFDYYDKMLKEHGLNLIFTCATHDIYFSKEKCFDGLSENEIKSKCVRIRNPQKSDKSKQKSLIKEGYIKVFDTTKKDYHYSNSTMKSRIQLQIIDNIGLVVYYDNPDYYSRPLDEQRKLLLNELNTYGFSFKEQDLGIDKLRTLYYGKEMFSENQNG